ncbi:MAG: ribosome maturation factor RimM [Crocinitomicaceae bacterium]|nr:ribosome maturation factor RimM [Crocinitomicaceae bacterium]
MHLKDKSYIGQIVKLHGYKGGVSLYMDVSNPKNYTSLQAVFIEIDGLLAPFFVSSLKHKNKGFVAIHFEGVSSELEAKKLLKKKVYISSGELNEVDETRFLGHKLLGYTVIDEQTGILGPLVQVLEQKGNPLFVIEKGGNEILIPLFEGLLLAIDEKKKEMLINTPEGLIDLYLQ